jgi:hypothetical protein
MIMADVFLWVFLIVGLLVVLVATWLLAAAVHPAGVHASRDRYRAAPWRLLLRGTLVTVPVAVAGLALLGGAPAPALRAVGLLLLAALAGAALLGAAGAAALVGAGLPSSRDPDASWRATLRGGTVLALAALVPVAGWLLLFPALLLSGVGAASHGFRRHRPEPAPAA